MQWLLQHRQQVTPHAQFVVHLDAGVYAAAGG